MIVDVHAHTIVPELLREAAPEEEWRPRLHWEDGRHVIEVPGGAIRSAVAEWSDPDAILAVQDAAGIDHVLLCPWVRTVYDELEPAECLGRARLQNAGLEALAGARADRISAIGVVPLQDPRLAATELRSLMAAGVLRGVEVAASVRGVYLGDDRFAPFWEAAEDTGALVFIHPTTRGFDAPVFSDYYLWNAVGNPIETTVCAAHLVLSGVLERHPGLRILLAHGGGALPALRGRLRHAWTAVPAARARLSESPEASLRRFYFDTVTHDPRLLRDLVEWAGADRVLLGSDYPFDMGDPSPVDTVRRAGLPDAVAGAVLGGNAVRLLGL